jgi:hypothetical protein
MTDDQTERLIGVFSRIADALDRAYPHLTIRVNTEPVITHILTDEEKLSLEQQGDPEDEIEVGGRRWDEPGPRESEYLGSTKRSE